MAEFDPTATNRHQVGHLLGVSVKQVAEYLARGCPGSDEDGKYHLVAIVKWCKANVWKKRGSTAGTDEDDELLAGPQSPALERYREERAKLARLDRLEREENLVSREDIRDFLNRSANVIRQAGETLQRRFGPDAHEILDEALQDLKRMIAEQFTDDRGEDE